MPVATADEAVIHVLHVDDDTRFADMVREYVETTSETVRFHSVESGVEALNRLDASIDCVVSDYRMPTMNGLELLGHLRRSHPTIPFILYTGEGSESLASRAIAEGVTDYISKDMGRDHFSLLVNRIRNAVKQYRAQQQADRQERIARITRRTDRLVATTEDRETIEQSVCEILVDTDPYEFAWIGGPAPSGGGSAPRAQVGTPDDFLAEITTRDGLVQVQPVMDAIATHRPTFIQLVGADETDENHLDAALSAGFHGIAVLPLVHDDTAYGVLAVYTSRGQAFDRAERELLEDIAHVVAHGLHRIRVTTDLGKEQAQTKAIAAASPDAIHLFDVDGRCRRAYGTEADPFQAEAGPVVGMAIDDLLPADSAERFLDRIEAAVEAGESGRVEFTVELDEQERWFETCLAALTDRSFGFDGVVTLTREITERKQRELETRSFWQAVEQAGHSIYRTDRDGIITYVNPAFERVTGYRADEAIGNTPRILKSGHHDEEYYDRLWTTICSGEIWEGRVVNRRKEGETYTVNQTIAPVFGPSGSIKEFVAINADITDQEERRTKLAEARKKYRALLDSAPDAIFVADRSTGEIREANQTAATLLDIPREEIIGRNQMSLHPSGESDRYRQLFERHATAEADGAVNRFPNGDPVFIERRDGELVPVEINTNTIELEGRSLVLGSFRDLREQMRREHVLTRLHDVTAMILSAESVEEACSIAGNSAIEILGFDRVGFELQSNEYVVEGTAGIAELSRGGPSTDTETETTTTEIAEDGRKSGRSARENGHEVREDERPETGADEIQIPLDDFGAMNLEKRGVDSIEQSDRLLATILGAHVVTALNRVEYETELRRHKRDLERRNEHLDSFAKTIAHDLRNPLSIASGHLELLALESDADHIAEITNAHRRMEALIDDLLSLARAGQPIGDEFATLELRPIARMAWDGVATGDASLTFDIDAPLTFRADETRIAELFENIFQNAAIHAGDAPTVTVGTLGRDGFYIEDDGSGIPAEVREKVFEKGFSTANQGTGLGLFITRTIAEAHGWDIDVLTGSDGGARFEFTSIDTVATSNPPRNEA